MSTSLQYSALSRILDLNTRVSNLHTQMLAEPVSASGSGPHRRDAGRDRTVEAHQPGRVLACRLRGRSRSLGSRLRHPTLGPPGGQLPAGLYRPVNHPSRAPVSLRQRYSGSTGVRLCACFGGGSLAVCCLHQVQLSAVFKWFGIAQSAY